MNDSQNVEPIMPAPKPGKHPMKTNVYLQARHSNAQLLPLFPYDGAGDMVPACASMRGFPGGPGIGYFQHTNTVDEIMVSFGSTGDIRSGDVAVGSRTHGVGGWGATHEFFAVMSITQRQMEGPGQTEALAFICEGCGAEIDRIDYPGQIGADEHGHFPAMPTIDYSAKWATRYNESEALRTCKACGCVNKPFPTYIWGWDRYMFNTGVVEEARAALEEAAK